ncbi:hypothetical protein GCK72_001532 [Caenorhabditis remanei]|uniref:Uncharacterized protein n=1 Tax=Caenorhabditis remanei TaxID=31234 RepID=A0A6A5HPZ1_CAERE|nr:hypothetical protein GCK72_001532 [Caenorhabditis remanei]KAF1769715.1 hypothetical protein GCK72_001532 [Caenorhabditis remanei]
MTTLYEKLNLPFGIGYTWIGAMIILFVRYVINRALRRRGQEFMRYTAMLDRAMNPNGVNKKGAQYVYTDDDTSSDSD